MNTVEIVVDSLLLKQQRNYLVRAINDSLDIDMVEHLDGILNMIDAIQDQLDEKRSF